MGDRPTLRSLLARRDLNLRAIGEIGDATLDRPLRWVHSSDLADPTPFLDEDVALLTTGTQFDGGEGFEPYVDRLVARGVAALGFGTEVVREGVPEGLIAACAAAGLALFEVPFRTPFIAVARANADALAAEAFARRSWALAAQRAISLAAFRPEPLGATLAELAAQLGRWVGLYDATGTLTHARPARLAHAAAHGLQAEVTRVLGAGVRAAETVPMDGRAFQIQTLGRGGALRGALAVEAAPDGRLDQEERGVVTTVVAMAGFALEQREELSLARASLRVGVLRALLRGELSLARDVAAPWGGLPAEPITVGLTRDDSDALLSYLELRAAQLRGRLAFGAHPDGGVAVIAGRGAPDVFGDIAQRFAAPVGVSPPAAYDRLPRAIDQARAARDRARGGVAVFRGGDIAVLDTLGDDARAAARAALAPLEEHPSLAATLRVWLEHDARFEDAARALGVHRHTVRARVARAEDLLGRELTSFAARADLWAALRATA